MVDFPGFGKSSEPLRPYKLRDYTNDLKTLLDKLNIKGCIFIAHSFGGRVAVDYVGGLIETNVKGIILVDSAGVKPRRGLKYRYRVLKYKIAKRMGRDVSKYGSSDYKALSPLMKQTFVNIVNEYTYSQMNNINIPTLLVWGENDTDTPLYMAKKMRKRINDSHLIIFNGRGHFAYLEEINRFVRLVDIFAGEVN